MSLSLSEKDQFEYLVKSSQIAFQNVILTMSLLKQVELFLHISHLRRLTLHWKINEYVLLVRHAYTKKQSHLP